MRSAEQCGAPEVLYLKSNSYIKFYLSGAPEVLPLSMVLALCHHYCHPPTPDVQVNMNTVEGLVFVSV